MKHIKKYLSFLLAATCFTFTLAAAPISVVVNEQPLTLSVEPTMINSKVYLPVRTFSEQLGYTVNYDSTSKQVTLKKDANLSLTLKASNANDGSSVLIQKGVAYLPIRLVSEYFGFNVAWNGTTQTVYLTPVIIKTDEELLQIAESLLDYTLSKDYDKAYSLFDNTLKSELSSELYRTSLSSFEELLGAPTDYSLIESLDASPYKQFNFKVSYKDSAIKYIAILDSTGHIAGIQTAFYQEDINLPAGAVEQEITIETDGYTLPGTLTLPNTTGNFPVVILVHGSGPNDRNETIYNTVPFKDISYGLAEKGIATLRYDKRTFTYSNLTSDTSLTLDQEVLDDVLSAISLMQGTEHINKNQIFVLGHSLGGMLVPMLNKKTSDVAGYIMASGPARNLLDVVEEQYNYLYNLDTSLSTEQKEATLSQIQNAIEATKALTLSNIVAELSTGGFNNTFWATLNEYDQVTEAKDITVPLFITQGERDYQVSMEDFDLWKKALNGKSNVTLKSYPGLNHCYVSGNRASVPNEYYLGGHVSDIYITDLAKWITNQAK